MFENRSLNKNVGREKKRVERIIKNYSLLHESTREFRSVLLNFIWLIISIRVCRSIHSKQLRIIRAIIPT